MKSTLVHMFKTSLRRALTSLASLALMGLSSWALVDYIDHRCAVPGLSFGLLVGWVCLLAALAWLLVMALSPVLIVPALLSEWARDPWRDEQLELELPQLDELDPRHYQINPQARFKTLYSLAVIAPLFITHLSADSFLTRFQREGSARVALRSPDRALRLIGLEQLRRQVAMGRAIQPSPELAQELIGLLKDPDLEVQERVASVMGAIKLESATSALERLATEAQGEGAQRLVGASLLALGQLKGSVVDESPARAALERLSASPEVMRRAPYELAIALGMQRIQRPEALERLYTLASGVGGEQEVREAAIWALGEARDSATLPLIARGLSDEALSVRCLAANALEKLTAFESSGPLRAAWPKAKKDQKCPLIESPKGAGPRVVMMPDWDYQHAIVHALASTDDPLLLTWLVEHQREVPPLTHRLMKKYYEVLVTRDKEGLLEEFKRRNQAARRKESSHE